MYYETMTVDDARMTCCVCGLARQEPPPPQQQQQQQQQHSEGPLWTKSSDIQCNSELLSHGQQYRFHHHHPHHHHHSHQHRHQLQQQYPQHHLHYHHRHFEHPHHRDHELILDHRQHHPSHDAYHKSAHQLQTHDTLHEDEQHHRAQEEHHQCSVRHQMCAPRRRGVSSGSAGLLVSNMAKALLAFCLLSHQALSSGEMRFVVEPSNRSVAAGWTVVLNCTVANRAGVVQWTKGGFGLGLDRSLPGFERYSIIGVEQQGAIGEFNLQIRGVTIDDDDFYECQVMASEDYPKGMRSRTAYLSVVVPPERPSIIRAPTIPVVLHQPTNITCRADKGKPAAQISWHLDGQRLTHGVSTHTLPHGKYIDTVSVLTFNSTLVDAAKRIECQAVTEFMERPYRTFATLDVQFAPDLQMSFNVTARKIREHDHIRFQCVGRANPANVIWKWYRNDLPIQDANSNTYHINGITPEHNNDKISCEGTNAVGTTRIDQILNVEYGARILEITDVVGADVGQPAELKCEADGNPAPNVIWRRKGPSAYAHLSTKSTYRIERVNKQSYGWYVCTATVIGFPYTSREAVLLENGPPVMKSEKKQTATESETGKLECITNSIPKPNSIVWSKNGKAINYAMSGRFSKEDKDLLYGAKSILHIHSVQAGDFGMYNCTVENNYGISHDQIELVEKHVLPITYIIIGIIGGLAVIFVIGLICVLYRRYRKEDQGSVLEPTAAGSYTDTDSSSDKKREKADSPNTLMGQLRQDYNKDVYRFSADYDDMPYKEQQAKGNNNGYGYIEPYEPYSDHQIYDGEYVRRGEDLVPDRFDPVYNGSTAYSLSSFRGENYDTATPPPTMTRVTPLHMSNSKLATDV